MNLNSIIMTTLEEFLNNATVKTFKRTTGLFHVVFFIGSKIFGGPLKIPNSFFEEEEIILTTEYFVDTQRYIPENHTCKLRIQFYLNAMQRELNIKFKINPFKKKMGYPGIEFQ